MTRTPTVSVLLMAYNHIDFVDEALSSIEDQRPPFDVEVILNDDFSTDGTLQRIERYAETSRHTCRIPRSERNLGALPAVARGIRAATGDYIAFLDADDRWCDPDKLARQSELLARRPDLAVAFHNVAVIDSAGARTGRLWNDADQKIETTLDDLMYGCYAHTSSLMIRRSALTPLPSSYDTFLDPVTDWPLLVLAAHSGGLHYDAPTMSEYRFHDGGLYQGLERRRQVETSAAAYLALKPLVAERLRHRLDEERRVFLGTSAQEAAASGRRRDALRHQWNALLGAVTMLGPRRALHDIRQLLRIALSRR